MPCHAMHPIQDLFLESFSYELQLDMHSYLHKKNFILAKSGCYMELVDHLMVQCVFSWEVWFLTLRRCGWEILMPSTVHTFGGWWVECQKQVVKGRRKVFDSLVISVAWSIWLQRNDPCFARICKPPAVVALDAWSLLEQWCRAGLVDR
jgi:hypothetical protein